MNEQNFPYFFTEDTFRELDAHREEVALSLQGSTCAGTNLPFEPSETILPTSAIGDASGNFDDNFNDALELILALRDRFPRAESAGTAANVNSPAPPEEFISFQAEDALSNPFDAPPTLTLGSEGSVSTIESDLGSDGPTDSSQDADVAMNDAENSDSHEDIPIKNPTATMDPVQNALNIAAEIKRTEAGILRIIKDSEALSNREGTQIPSSFI